MNVIIVTCCLAHVLFVNIADAKTVKGFENQNGLYLKNATLDSGITLSIF